MTHILSWLSTVLSLTVALTLALVLAGEIDRWAHPETYPMSAEDMNALLAERVGERP